MSYSRLNGSSVQRRRNQRKALTKRRLFFESFEVRLLMAADWRNPVDALDVDSDRLVAPIDALIVINDLNDKGARQLPPQRDPGASFLDVSGDQFIAPVDVVRVINYLNSDLGSPRSLSEGDRLSSEASVTITLGQISGSRLYRVQLDATFDTTDKTTALEDVLAVYLVNPTTPDQTLLDRGTPGTAIFTLAGSKAEYAPGVVRWDGSILEIDTSKLATRDTGELKFQLLSSDRDSGTHVTIKPLANTVDPNGTSNPAFPNSDPVATAGAATNLTSLSAATNAQLDVGNVRFQGDTGRFSAELSLRNNEGPLGRTVAVVFPGLPAGVTLRNPSGTSAEGSPYVNFQPTIPRGGLGGGMQSGKLLVEFDDPNQIQFELKPQILAATDQPPQLAPIAALTVMPGETLHTQLLATDPDGDPITYSLAATSGAMALALPTGALEGNGLLTFTPALGQIGSRTFDVVASDGVLEARRTVTLDVVADPVTTTRIAGTVLQSDGQPLENLAVEVGATQTRTAADGTFTLDLGDGELATDVLKVRGDQVTGTIQYPLLAEKLRLLLNHEVYAGAKNAIGGPIYLPTLDIENGTTIDPGQNQTVTTTAVPELSVQVDAGSLKKSDNSEFASLLSLTNVSLGDAPANVPAGLNLDQLFIVGPGDLSFTSPAPVTVPNPSGFAGGTVFDLWLLNPSTGVFEDVGDLQVRGDGSALDTVSGGLTHTGWFIPGLKPPTAPSSDVAPATNARNHPGIGPEDTLQRNAFGATDVQTGNVNMTHDLVPYFALGESRGLRLNYDSLRADPRPIIHFGFDATPTDPNMRLVADLTIQSGSFSLQVPGVAGGQMGLASGEHIWALPVDGGGINVALQADLRTLPSGKYDYVVNEGLRHFDGQTFSGSSVTETGSFVSINSSLSPFGSGWNLAGLDQIVENPDGSVLLIDGDGTNLLFEPPLAVGGNYLSPPGDFSVLHKEVDGTFRLRNKVGTSFNFNAAGQLVSILDRQLNQTKYEYDDAGRLTQVTDPVGLITNFTPDANGRINKITDPAGRVTKLDYDAAGNLIRITDPDDSQRAFAYDSAHYLVQETDQLGRVQSMTYDFAGRAEDATRKDGSVIHFAPLQSIGLLPPDQTVLPLTPPTAPPLNPPAAMALDGIGNIRSDVVDNSGQPVQTADAIGSKEHVYRNDKNLIVMTVDARNFPTVYRYDDKNNVVERADLVSGPNVYIVTSSDAQRNQTVMLDLAEQGFVPILGQQLDQFDGSELSVFPYEAVVVLDDYGATPVDMPTAGQNALATFVNGDNTHFGKSMIVDAGLIADASATGPFSILFPLLPATFGGFVAGTTTSYSPNPTNQTLLDEGLPTDFSVTIPSLPRTGDTAEAELILTEGASEFFTSSLTGQAGVAGVDKLGQFFQGRVAALSTFLGSDVLNDSTYQTLFGNVLRWSTQNGPISRHYTYDAFSLVTSEIDEARRTTKYDRDPANANLLTRTRVHSFDSSRNEISTYTYAAHGQLASITDPLGHVTADDYDSNGRMITVTFAQGTPDEGVVHLEYDAAGNQTAEIDENGHRKEYVYDSMNRLTKVTEPDPDGPGPLTSPVTVYTYDAAGNMLTMTDSRGNQTKMDYDALDRLIRTTDSQGTQEQSYDLQGNVASLTDAAGNRTSFRYDARNRLVDSINPQDGVTHREYDAVNNLVALTDPAGNRFSYVYDARGRVSSETDPLGKTSQYQYDHTDNLIAYTDRNGRLIEYGINSFNRLFAEEWHIGHVPISAVIYTYDKAGRLIKAKDDFSSLTYTYDARNRVKSVDNVQTPGAPTVVLTYTHDAVGNQLSTEETIDGQAGALESWTYDALNRPIRITQSGAGTSSKRVDIDYDSFGNLTTIDRFADLAGIQEVARTDNTFDSLNRLTGVTHTRGSTMVDFEQLTIDPVGRITSRTNPEGTQTFHYDSRNQLLSGSALGGAAAESYGYDADGNRTQSSRQGTALQIGPGNRLVSDGAYNYAYDENGNMIRRTEIATNKAQDFTYDHRNRITQIQEKDVDGNVVRDTKYTYDVLDRRISESVSNNPQGGSPVPVEYFIYSGSNVRLDFLSPDGVAAPTLERRYLDGPLVDQVFAQDAGGGNVQWMLTDHLGSTRDLVDNQGAVQNHLTYDSFGNLLSKTDSAVASRYLYVGREYVAGLDLYYNRARYYDPTTGRFLGEDPVGADLNQYRYVGNNPLALTDPTGLCPHQDNLYTSEPPWRGDNQNQGDGGSEGIKSARPLSNDGTRSTDDLGPDDPIPPDPLRSPPPPAFGKKTPSNPALDQAKAKDPRKFQVDRTTTEVDPSSGVTTITTYNGYGQVVVRQTRDRSGNVLSDDRVWGF